MALYLFASICAVIICVCIFISWRNGEIIAARLIAYGSMLLLPVCLYFVRQFFDTTEYQTKFIITGLITLFVLGVRLTQHYVNKI